MPASGSTEVVLSESHHKKKKKTKKSKDKITDQSRTRKKKKAKSVIEYTVACKERKKKRKHHEVASSEGDKNCLMPKKRKKLDEGNKVAKQKHKKKKEMLKDKALDTGHSVRESNQNHQVSQHKSRKTPRKKSSEVPKQKSKRKGQKDANETNFPEWSQEMSKKLNCKQGSWTKKEEKILKNNMDRYLKENNIDDPSILIFAYQNTETDEAKKWKEFSRNTDFYRELGKGLNRSLYFVYRKVLRFFDKRNYMGKFSESEDDELQQLVAIHGRNWSKIGGIMERSGLSLQHRYYFISSGIKCGPWKDSEVVLLREAVRTLTNTKEFEEVYVGINWVAVATIVKTRNCHQCRRKWLHEICWKECQLSTWRRWSVEQDAELISRIYNSSVMDECDIDWPALAKDFDMAHSPCWLQVKFSTMKRKYCKSIDFVNTEFEDLIDYLKKEVKGNATRPATSS